MNTAQLSATSGNRVALAIFLIALLAIPFCFAQANITALQTNPGLLLVFGLVSLTAVAGLAYGFVFRYLPAPIRHSPYLLVFAVFAFAAMIDLLISLTLMGFTDVMRAYVENGEPYLQSRYGMAVNFWDGTVHLGLYIWMSYCLASSRPHSRAALFWAGSIIGSCIVYMTGNLIGEYAEAIEPSILLNIPFMLVPIFYAWKTVVEDKSVLVSARRALSFEDYLLVLALLVVSGFSAFRLLVVLSPDISLTAHWASAVEPYLFSPARYPQLQMLVYGFYMMPFAILAVLSFWRPPSRSLAVWSWVFAGVIAQGQFSHMLASINAHSDSLYAIAAAQQINFWSLNLFMMAVPIWYAWRYQGKILAVV